MVLFQQAHGKNPDSRPNQGSWGGKAPQTPSQGKRENVRDETVCDVRLLTERDTVSLLGVSTHGPLELREV
jgi:hypothetical protein